MASYLVRELSENSTRYEDILCNFTIYVLPVFNPDGYEYSHTSKTSKLATLLPITCHAVMTSQISLHLVVSSLVFFAAHVACITFDVKFFLGI